MGKYTSVVIAAADTAMAVLAIDPDVVLGATGVEPGLLAVIGFGVVAGRRVEVVAEKLLGHFDPAVIHKIARGNAIRLLGLDLAG